jgi:hypothetical protein
MGNLRTWARFTVLAFALTPFSASTAFALPGEAKAVIAHCGQPTTQFQGVSPVTGLTQRDLTYTGTILHFEPMEDGWSFTTAWKGHLPVSRAKLETEMPCFRDAMQEVAARPALIADPTLTADHTAQPTGINFGPTFLWIIFGLAVVMVIFLSIPSRRRRVAQDFMPPSVRRRPGFISMPNGLRRKRQTPNPPQNL